MLVVTTCPICERSEMLNPHAVICGKCYDTLDAINNDVCDVIEGHDRVFYYKGVEYSVESLDECPLVKKCKRGTK